VSDAATQQPTDANASAVGAVITVGDAAGAAAAAAAAAATHEPWPSEIELAVIFGEWRTNMQAIPEDDRRALLDGMRHSPFRYKHTDVHGNVVSCLEIAVPAEDVDATRYPPRLRERSSYRDLMNRIRGMDAMLCTFGGVVFSTAPWVPLWISWYMPAGIASYFRAYEDFALRVAFRDGIGTAEQDDDDDVAG
jgi:hypothetical protein